MAAAASLQPTLWRTCRVLANRTRLGIFALLAEQSPQTVSALAFRLQVTLPVASQALRSLEARGLLAVQRVGRRVQYRPSPLQSGHGRELAPPLRRALRNGFSAVDSLFRLCTAFTHPRRIELYRALRMQPRTFGQLRTATRISGPALTRHLAKLEARSFVVREGGLYTATLPREAFGRVLARLAVE
jgi:DNA-binding transcriptional ArsR family regulator